MRIKPECKIEKLVGDETRPQLANAFLEIDEKRAGTLVATNGRALAAIHATVEDSDNSGFVSPIAIKEWRKQSKKSYVQLVANGSLKILGTSFERPTEENSGRYPNWRIVLPKSEEKEEYEITLNAALLLDIQEALGQESVTIKFYGKDKVMTIEGINGIGALMPVRK